MKVRKIVLRVLASLVLSGCLAVPHAVKIDGITCTKKEIIKLVKDRPNRGFYIDRKVNLFDDILSYCSRNRSYLRASAGDGLLSTRISAYIGGNHFFDINELNVVDSRALAATCSYDELVYNLAVLYLSYKDLSDPVEFSKHFAPIGEVDDPFMFMEPFHTADYVPSPRESEDAEQKAKDEARVAEFINARIWSKKPKSFFSGSGTLISSHACRPVDFAARPGTPSALSRSFEDSEEKNRDGTGSVPICLPTIQSMSTLHDDSDSDDGDFDDLFPTPSDFMAALSRRNSYFRNSSVPRRPLRERHVPLAGDLEKVNFGGDKSSNFSEK